MANIEKDPNKPAQQDIPNTSDEERLRGAEESGGLADDEDDEFDDADETDDEEEEEGEAGF